MEIQLGRCLIKFDTTQRSAIEGEQLLTSPLLFDDSILIYILPPSLEALRERLLKRGLDSPEMIQLRLTSARRDIEEAHWYHYLIVNERIDDAIEELKAIIIVERCRKVKDSVLGEKMREWEEHHGKNYC